MAIDLARIENWLRRRALPLWATEGWDSAYGGFHDRLDRSGGTAILIGDDGAPMAKRLRVQARQIYVYSHAAMLDLDPQGVARARAGFDFMVDHYWHQGGGWIFSCDREGRPANRDRDLYEQAFALLSLAWFYRASGDTAALDWAAKTARFLDEVKSDPEQGGFWDERVGALPRCQNPHMHLLEAWLALYGATGDKVWVDRAAAIIALVEDRLRDKVSGTIGEYFDAEWRPAAGKEGQIVEPGHQYEWAWLLAQYGAAADRDMGVPADRLYGFATSHGIDADGLVFDAVLRDGALHDANKRLWVQTEALKAAVSRYEILDDMDAARRTDKLLNLVFDHYLDEGRGDFEEHLGRDRAGFRSFAPASSLYHLFLAFAEVLRVFGADGE